MNNVQLQAGQASRTRELSGGTGSLPIENSGGFTIVETMIVLAVTGMLLLSAMSLIVGQQNKVQFSQSIQEVQSSIQQTMNEVSTGYYPDPGNLRCTAAGNGPILETGSTPTKRGSNTGCLFLGKAIQFGVRNVDPQEYIVHSIAGLDKRSGALIEALPKAIAPGSASPPNFPNASERKRLLYGLDAISMYYIEGSGPARTRKPIGAVAFVSGLGSYDVGNQLMSGTQQISLIPVGGSAPNVVFTNDNPLTTESDTVVDAINNNLKNETQSPPDPQGGVEICFASGGTEQSGLITIGSNGRSLAVNLAIKSTRDCT